MHRYEITYAPRSTSQKNEHHSIRITLSSLEVAIAHAFTRFIGEIPMRINLVETGREVWNRSKGSPYWIHWGTLVRDPYTMNFCSDEDAHLWVGAREGVNKITHLEKDGRLVWEKDDESVREVPKVLPQAPEAGKADATHLLLYDDKSSWIYASDDIAAIEYATRPDEICPSHVVRIGGSVIWQAPPPARKPEPDGGSCPLYPPLPEHRLATLRRMLDRAERMYRVADSFSVVGQSNDEALYRGEVDALKAVLAGSLPPAPIDQDRAERVALPAITPAQQGTLRKLLAQISDRIPPGTLPHNPRMRQLVLEQQRDSTAVLRHILSCAVVQSPAALPAKPYVTIEELDDIVARTRAQRRGPAEEASRRFQRGFTDHAQDMLVAEALLVAEGRS